MIHATLTKNFVMLLIFVNVSLQTIKKPDDDCSNYDSACSECVQNAPCQWCSVVKKASFEGRHCFSRKINLEEMCANDHIEKPRNHAAVDRNERLTDNANSRNFRSRKGHRQFRPQEYTLRLRKGRPLNITFTFRQVPDYPLDLYYLMDFSYSMEPHKETLSRVGSRLAATMRTLTSQFKIGFGSFVDKVMLPFVNIHPEVLKRPCVHCTRPFSFRNNLPLTEDDRKFEDEMRQTQLSGNIDSPEGGLDALMQTIVCKREIGWRDNVRKIIVFSTDALLHTAGDGKLAGVMEPNDGRCHLNGGNEYLKYDVYDYPSLGHINEVAKEHGINIIFASAYYETLYRAVADTIEGASYAPLKNEKDTIINIIKDVYNSITSKVDIQVRNATHKDLHSIRFISNCNSKISTKDGHVSCDGVKKGSTISVIAEIELLNCPANGDRKSTIFIGTNEETIKLNIEMACDCGCQKTNTRTSVNCSNSGYEQCGVCKCSDASYGATCECKKDPHLSKEQSHSQKCKPANARPDTPVCSSKGVCICGECKCSEKDHHGKFCQWDKGNCMQTSSSEICSGNGREGVDPCQENKCQCKDDWEGTYCQCPHHRICKAKGDSEVCSGIGDCDCGRCSCKEKNGVQYTGEFCEDCPVGEGGLCKKSKCSLFRDCVQCLKWKRGLYNDAECSTKCSTLYLQTRKSLDEPIAAGARLCTFTDTNGCDFNFTYKYLVNREYQVLAQGLQKCPYGASIYAHGRAVFSVIAGIVGLGILTLIMWKLLTHFYDEREYARFMKEYESQKWTAASNPMYVAATTQVQNPAYVDTE